jgi:hypothetical protein
MVWLVEQVEGSHPVEPGPDLVGETLPAGLVVVVQPAVGAALRVAAGEELPAGVDRAGVGRAAVEHLRRIAVVVADVDVVERRAAAHLSQVVAQRGG